MAEIAMKRRDIQLIAVACSILSCLFTLALAYPVGNLIITVNLAIPEAAKHAVRFFVGIGVLMLPLTLACVTTQLVLVPSLQERDDALLKEVTEVDDTADTE